MEDKAELRHRKMVPAIAQIKDTTKKGTKMVTERENIPLSGDKYAKNTNYNGSVKITDYSDTETSLTRPLLDGSDSEAEVVTPGVKIEEEIREPDEPSWLIGIQVFLPYIIAGLGTVGAGMVLDVVQHWSVFVKVSEVFILVPSLLGLKGNLEMTLASRLSTQANLGHMDTDKEMWRMIGGNIALTQAQAIVVGFLASIAAVVFGWIPEGKFDIHHGLLLCASSVLTAALASFLLGSIMVVVIILSRKCHVNPDNIATPIAASLGDLITLSLLAYIATFLYNVIPHNDTDIKNHHTWIAPMILVVFLVLTPIWCVISHKNKYTHEVLYTGWTPVICAMVISSIGGLILDFAVARFKGLAVFQPVMNGVGGNLVAVQASRLSTALHRAGKPGKLPAFALNGCPNICSAFLGKGIDARTARVLMLLVVPGHALFITVIHYTAAGHTTITWPFLAFYLIAAVIQVMLLLFIANWMVHYMWKKGDDPDNFAIPYLTALGDLFGTGLLAAVFFSLSAMGIHVHDGSR